METGRVNHSQNQITVSIIGAGNVASHIGRALYDSGVIIRTVSARTMDHAVRLAAEVGASAIDSISEIPNDVDFIIISTTDASIVDIAAELPDLQAVIVHTSGSVPLEMITKYHSKCGVLYPLQTFSRDVDVEMSRVPFFTEASDDYTLAKIDSLARCISLNVYHADSHKRRALHIAGVLTSNFTIYLLEMAQRVLASEDYPIDVVQPLVEASMAKAFAVGPHNALTGPARRGDRAVVELHQQHLQASDAEIYRVISDAILNEFQSEQN